MTALDLFCGGGGVAEGLIAAGFQVTGIDTNPRCAKYYPGTFITADATAPPLNVQDFDFIWASPPCQRFSWGTPKHRKKLHPNLIPHIRQLLANHPVTCIENVPAAPIRPDLRLTGPTVGLNRIHRKRHFELSFELAFYMPQPPLLSRPREDWAAGRMCVITKGLCSSGHYYARKAAGLSGRIPTQEARDVMGIKGTMTADMVGEAIPPAYARVIGEAAAALIANRN